MEKKQMAATFEFVGKLKKIEKETDKFKAFEEKYEYFPFIYLDCELFNKAKTKYINDNVQFKKGIVKISVEYLDD